MNKRLIILILMGALLLLAPFVAMQFSTEVNWGVFDFIVAGSLIFGLISLVELIVRRSKPTNLRFLMIAGSVLLFLIIWIELAVGIFGSPIAGN